MAKRTIITPYRTYMFKDKDPAIYKIKTILSDSGKSYWDVHEATGVSVTTLSNWFTGNTRRPQFATLNAVARALKHEWKLVKY
jgi:transcriptional regulator with XRE-family HTH domain